VRDEIYLDFQNANLPNCGFTRCFIDTGWVELRYHNTGEQCTNY